MYSRIIGTGSGFPEKVLTNHDLAKLVDTSDEWITERTGIRERRVAGPNENAASLGAIAARNAVEAAGIELSDIDMIIMGTTSSTTMLPSAAVEVQRLLDLPNIPAFDVSAACSGFIFTLSIADQFIRAGSAKNILVIGADTLSKICDPNDRTTLVLFGDGAGAVVLSASEEQGIISTHLHSDGNYQDLLGAKAIPPGQNVSPDYGYLYMKGNEVFKVAVKKLSEIVTETMEANDISKEDIDWLVPHQANLRIISATAKKLSLDMDRVVINLDRYGNTSAATIPTALDEAVRDGRIKRGQTLLFEAFGSGFAWGSALVKY